MVVTTSPAPAAPRLAARWSLRRAGALGLGLALVVGVMVTAFAWPAVRTSPHDVPIAVVGPQAAAQQVAHALEQAQPGAFQVEPTRAEDDARAAIASREVAGAIVLGGQGVTVLTAPGGGQAVATLLRGVGDAVGAELLTAQGGTVVPPATTEVVVPGGAGDVLGVGFPMMTLPVVMGSLMLGLVASMVVRGAAARLTTLLVGGTVAGGVVAVVAGSWLEIVPATWRVAGVLGLGVLAVSGAVAGAHALLGRIGVVLVAPTILLLGNPLSAAAGAPELVPAGWASLGQALPPGALVQALRSVAFFDGAAAAFPLTVLGAWSGVGLALVVTALVGERPTRLRSAAAGLG